MTRRAGRPPQQVNGRPGSFGLRLVAVAGSALVLQFFSEFYFMNEGPAALAAEGLGGLAEMAELTLWYGLFGYVFLIVLDRCEVGTLAGLMLAGSIFGWSVEGVVIPVVYEAPPLSFLWPSVGWHALVDVVLGWVLLRLAMRRLAWPWLVVLFAALGVVWAFWASWTWGEVGASGETAVVFTEEAFATIVAVSGATWLIGTALADIGARAAFRASRWEVAVVALAAVALFAITGAAHLPWSAALALLVVLVLGALHRGRGGATRGALLAPLAVPPPPAAYAAMPLMPIAAALTYPVVLDRDLAIPAEDTVLLLVLLGALGFVWALAKAVRKGSST